MDYPLPRYALYFFTAFCLGFGLVTLPAHPAQAGETITFPGAPLQGIRFGGNELAPSGSNDGTGYKNNSLSNNRVTMSGGTVDEVYGAVNLRDSEAVTNNTVIISDGIVNFDVYGGLSGSGNAAGNRVTISGGTVGESVVGGVSDTGNATGNRVTISGGTVGENVIGGYSGSGNATGNTVTISGNPIFGGGTILRGGLSGGDAFTDNTLNLWNDKGSGFTVNSVDNFQYLNFIFPTTQGNAPVLTGAATLGNTTYGNSTITANTIGGSAPLQPGATVTLINGAITNNGLNTQAQGQHGAVLQYNWALTTPGDAALVATLESVQANPQAKALSEGFAAGAVLINEGADVLAGPGMANAVATTAGIGPSVAGFGALTGGAVEANTGSHVRMKSVSLLAGLAWGRDLTPGRLTLGVFMEYGNGNYDTFNSFANGNIRGSGDVWHLGGGVLGRMDCSGTEIGNFYTEGSFRAGKVHNEYRNSDLTDGMGNSANFDSSTAYYGFHLGAGYIWHLSDKASLDTNAKYFWTRQQGDSVTLSTGDPVKFKDSDSSRTRLGSRFSYTLTDHFSPYIGAAWEHEFDGRARATSYGYSLPAPSMKGSTGIGELGFTFTPSENRHLSFDIGVQGYTGKREGVTGSLQMRWEF